MRQSEAWMALARLRRRLPFLLAALLTTAMWMACVQSGAAPSSRAPVPETAPVVFQGVTVVGVTDGRLHADQTVVVAGRRVQAVGPTAEVRLPPGAHIVDARGKYLIPGLWDMHFHSYETLPLSHYQLLVANGVTGIRDPAPFWPLDSLRRWRAAIAAGTLIGPRQVLTGTILDASNQRDNQGLQETLEATTPAQARHLIDSLQRAGAEFIKTHADPDRATFFAMASEVKRLGIRLEGHLPLSHVTIVEASDSGMRVIDHLRYLLQSPLSGICAGDSASLTQCRTLAARLRRNRTWIQIGPSPDTRVISNLPYLSDSIRNASSIMECNTSPGRQRWCATMALMARAGMPLLSGTDATLTRTMPMRLIHEELVTAVRSGLTPLQALQTVTLNPAEYLGGTDSLGTVAPGKLADLVLLDADPLADITNTARVRAVVANGRYFDRVALDGLLAEVVHKAAEAEQARAKAATGP